MSRITGAGVGPYRQAQAFVREMRRREASAQLAGDREPCPAPGAAIPWRLRRRCGMIPSTASLLISQAVSASGPSSAGGGASTANSSTGQSQPPDSQPGGVQRAGF